MPPPRTFGIFRDHQAFLRPAHNDNHFHQEWNAKTPPQRAEWLWRFEEIERAQANYNHHNNATNGLMHAINVAHNNLPGNAQRQIYDQFFRNAEQAYLSIGNKAVAAERLARKWQALHDVEFMHHRVSPFSLQYDLNLVIWGNQQGNQARAQQQRIARYRHWPRVPADPAGGQARLPEEWVLGEPGVENYRNAVRRNKMHLDDVNAGDVKLVTPGVGTWHMWRAMEGGMGFGGVWLRFDNNQVLDRTVVPDDEREWRDPTKWQGDVTNPARAPMELDCHHALRNITGVARMVDPGWVDDDYLAYGAYTEWCQHNTLDDVIRLYQVIHQRIPEPFLWFVAERLADAGLVMAHRPPDGNNFPRREIIHRDIKPSNVFLAPALNRGNIYRDYPEPRLGDFGLAIRTLPTDPNNPDWYQNAGTQGFLSPEQRRWVDGGTREYLNAWQLGEKTNVYGCGLVLWCLVTQERDPPIPPYLGNGAEDNTLTLPVAVQNDYSDRLVQLVEECTRFRPGTRPDFQQILAYIQVSVNPIPHDLARGLRNKPFNVVTPPALQLLAPPNNFQLGLAFAHVPL